MGTGSSREHRRGAAPTVRNHQPARAHHSAATSSHAMPQHLAEQFRPGGHNGAPPSQAAPRMSPNRPAAVQEGQKVKMLATVEPTTVHYEPNNQLLVFRISSQVPTVTYYEVHVAVRETIRDGAVVYTPNKPKTAPLQIGVEGPQDDAEYAVQLDLTNVSDQEMKYNKAYPKQRPCVIVIMYRDEAGKEHREHTSVDLAHNARHRVIGQVVETLGSCYAAENLFGGEHEDVTVGAVMDESQIEGGTSPAAGVKDDDDDDGLCVICLTNDKDTAVIPCRHLCLCKECAEQLMNHTPKCPVCRGPIAQLLHMGK